MLLALCRPPLTGHAGLQAAEQEHTNLQLLEEGGLLRQQLQERRAQLQQAEGDVHLLQVCSAPTSQCSSSLCRASLILCNLEGCIGLCTSRQVC